MIAPPADLELLRTLFSERFGLHLDDSRLGELRDLLAQRIRARGERGEVYLRHLPGDERELRELATQVTVSETFFLRYQGHFRAFADIVLPGLARVRRVPRPLRILSAGCASGEEAYTLAIVLREALADIAAWKIELLGFDLNPHVVARARAGRYSAWSLREVPPELELRWFKREGNEFVIDPSIRRMAAFESRNLVEDDPLFWTQDAFDIVFCRNVLMYLTATKAREAIARIERSLAPGGFLFLGHAETLRGLSERFHLCHSHDAFYYRLRGAEGEAVTQPAELFARPPRSDRPISPALGLADSSWIDVIKTASEHVTALSEARRSREPEAPVRPVARWERGPALEMLRQERFAEAMDLLRAAPKTSDPETQLLWAVLLTNSGQLERAELACQGVLAVDELSCGAHYLLALCRDHAGDRTAAIDHDQTAAYLAPSFAMPHLHMGLLARRARNMESARAELQQALALLGTEDASRILLYGGGFNREGLRALCRAELSACGGVE